MMTKKVRNFAKLGFAILLSVYAMEAYAERGFWKIEDIAKSPAFAKTVDSIFLITVPAGKTLTLDLKKYPTIDAAMSTFADNGTLNEAEKILRKRLIGRCFDKREHLCTVWPTFELGSMFLANNPQTGISAFHVFRDFLKGKSSTVIPFIVQDRIGKIIYGAKENETATIDFVRPEVLKNPERTTPYFDVIVLKLSRAIQAGALLPLSNEEPKVGENVIHIGYPGKTYDRMKVLGKPDSDGVNLFATSGPVLDNGEYLRRTGKDIYTIPADTISLLGMATLFSDADSYFGMSGAPTFNSRGEIVGMVIGSHPVDGSASTQTSVVSLRLNWVLALMAKK